MSRDIDFKDSHMIQPLSFPSLNFQLGDDTKSSMSTPTNMGRRISKGKVVVESQERLETSLQTELNIDAFFSDILEFRDQDKKIVEVEPEQTQ